MKYFWRTMNTMMIGSSAIVEAADTTSASSVEGIWRRARSSPCL